MIKGVERKIITVKNTGSPYIEEAYFLLKKECALSSADIIGEANRIVNSLTSGLFENGKKEMPKKGIPAFLYFLAGCAGGIVTALCLSLG